MAELLRTYSSALRIYLTAGRRVPADLADDILHDFIADRVLTRKLLERADRDKGKFRNYLLKSLSNFATTRLGREQEWMARMADLSEADVATTAAHQDTDRFDQEWVGLVVRGALELMEAECRERERSDVWTIFRARVVEPLLAGAEPEDYGDLVKRLQIETPRQAINLLATGKRSFTRHLRTVVGSYAGREDRVEREIADLAEIVNR